MSTHPDPHSLDQAANGVAEVSSHTLPVGPASGHHDGWTRSKQAIFLRELAATQNVSAAARSVGMSRQSAYQLRVRLKGEPFDRAWEAAFHAHFDALAEKALDRAINGVEIPHYYNGELIGTSRRYDERLTLALLSMRRSFVRVPKYSNAPSAAFDAEDLPGLIARVQDGPEQWRQDADQELEARYGPVEVEDSEDDEDDTYDPEVDREDECGDEDGDA